MASVRRVGDGAIRECILIGGSLAVRLPPEFWSHGHEVRIERRGEAVVLSPIARASSDEILKIFGQRAANDNETSKGAETLI